MSSRPSPSPVSGLDAEAALLAVPVPNLRARVVEEHPDHLVIEVPLAWPLWLRPFRRLMGLRDQRRYRLDGLGLLLWRRIDGRTTVAGLVEILEREEALSFHESRLLLASWLGLLSRRALVVAGVPAEPRQD